MPTISMFFGLIIRMYFEDHNPPHIHVEYKEYDAVYDLNGTLKSGSMPSAQNKLIAAWCEIHGEELLANWELCKRGELPYSIKPLE